MMKYLRILQFGQFLLLHDFLIVFILAKYSLFSSLPPINGDSPVSRLQSIVDLCLKASGVSYFSDEGMIAYVVSP